MGNLQWDGPDHSIKTYESAVGCERLFLLLSLGERAEKDSRTQRDGHTHDHCNVDDLFPHSVDLDPAG